MAMKSITENLKLRVQANGREVWVARWRERGQAKFRTLGPKTDFSEGEAKRLAEKVVAESRAATATVSEPVTLRQCYQAWVGGNRYCNKDGSPYSDETKRSHAAWWKTLDKMLGDMPVAKITTAVIEGRFTFGLAQDKIRRGKVVEQGRPMLAYQCIQLLSRICEEYLDLCGGRNPCHAAQKPSKPKLSKVRPLSKAEQQTWLLLINGDRDDVNLCWQVMHHTACRRKDVEGMRWEDLSADFQYWQCKVKGGEVFVRNVSAVADRLKRYRDRYAPGETHGRVFDSKIRSRIDTSARRHARSLGRKFSPHVIRHSRCTDMLSDPRVNLEQVRRQMTHASLTTTQKYAHLGLDSTDRTAAVLAE